MEQTIKYKNHTIEIVYDTDPQNPRTEWDNACTMNCWHRRYNLGDRHDHKEPIDLLYELAGIVRDYREEDYEYADLYKIIEERGTIIKTLSLYDHSGLSISIGNCSGWDQGPVGWIYITKDKIVEEWGEGPEVVEAANKYMEGEIETYDQYLQGQVYGYKIEETGDSCWGYYDVESAIADAKCEVDYSVKHNIKKHLQQLKQWIKAKVPVIYRKPMELV